MAVRRRAEPGVLIGRGQCDRVEPGDFVAVANDTALRVAIAPAVLRALAADAGEAVVDMDETRGHGVSAFGRRRWFRDSIVPPVGKKCQGGVRGWPAPSDGAAGLAPGERSAAATPPPARGRGRADEHTSQLQSLMRTPYAVLFLKTKT